MFEDVRLRRSPSYWLLVVGGRGRFESGERSERWRTRGVLAGVRLSLLGGRRDVFDALRDGGPTKSAGAGRRLDCIFEVLVVSEDVFFK